MRLLGAYVLALPSAFLGATGLFVALGPWRRSNLLLRFMARAVICTGGWLVFGFLMRLVGGECWLAGPSRYGGYDSTPFTGRDVVSYAVGLGILFAFLAPLVGKAKGLSLEW